MKTTRRTFLRDAAGLSVLACSGGMTFATPYGSAPLAKLNSRVVSVDGILKLEIDGKVFDPLSFRSFRPVDHTINDFHKAGVKLMSILTTGLNCSVDVPYSYYGETWVGPGQYDFSALDKQMDLFLKNAPDTYFNLMFQLDNRQWWVDQHPGTLTTYRNLVDMVTNEAWRQDALAYMKALIDHAERKYGDRVYSYSPFCGWSTEWYQNGKNATQVENNPLRLDAFRRFTKNPQQELPTVEELSRTSNGVFRDPVKDARALAYWRFQNESIADTILYFVKEAKKAAKGQKLIGLFYGYLMELHNTRLLHEGHLGYEKIFTSPDIDIIYAPASYGPPRTLGGASGFLNTIDSLQLKKKLYFHEVDHATHTAPTKLENGRSWAPEKFKNVQDTIAVLRREFVMTRAKRVGLWWFDLFGGYYDDPALVKEVTNMMRVQQKLDGVPMRSVAEIAVFGDVNSMFYVNQHARVNDDCLVKGRDELNRIGAPYDLYDFGFIDDPALPHDQYKLYIFLNAFKISDAQRKLIDKQVKQKGRTALWVYAPGYVQDKGFDTKAMSEIIGINVAQLEGKEQIIAVDKGFAKREGVTYKTMLPTAPAFYIDDSKAEVIGKYETSGKPALGYKKIGNHTAYYSALGGLTTPVFREVARQAGVHIYHEGSDPVYVNNRLIGIHIQGSTAPTISLPLNKAIVLQELFDGGQVTAQNGTCQLPADTGTTKLYLLADAEISLVKRS